MCRRGDPTRRSVASGLKSGTSLKVCPGSERSLSGSLGFLESRQAPPMTSRSADFTSAFVHSCPSLFLDRALGIKHDDAVIFEPVACDGDLALFGTSVENFDRENSCVLLCETIHDGRDLGTEGSAGDRVVDNTGRLKLIFCSCSFVLALGRLLRAGKGEDGQAE